MDGTFSSCPVLWDQIYILHIPACVCIATRSSDDYIQETVQAAQEPRARETSPRICTSSNANGLAAIQAIHAEFPNAEVKGCFFHYSQAIWRKTQNLGLAVLYKEDPQVQ